MRSVRPVSCAICAAVIRGEPFLEPLGKDDALVPVCRSCATEAVVPREHVPVRTERKIASSPRAAQIRESRARLFAQGLCTNGANHGRATNGKLCKRCHDRWGAGKGRGTNP